MGKHRIFAGCKMFAGIIALLAALTVMSGCQPTTSDTVESGPETGSLDQKIVPYYGEKSRAVSYVYTARKELALTFNGMGDSQTMRRLLDELDKFQIKATFFLPGMRVAEEPDIARDILARGHEIENNTLNRLDLTKLSYEQIYKEIHLANEVIQKETGVKPRYVRTKSGDYNDDVRLAAAHLGMDAVIQYNINPKDWDMKDAQAIGHYVERYISRGGIISLNTDKNPEVIAAIALIAKAAKEIDYKLITLDELMKNGGERKPLEQIPGYDKAQINLNAKNPAYKLVYNVDTNKKQVALTFDDWGSDKTVSKILDILKEHQVPATFFLRANGVKNNPNLARAILEDGHDVANHTYSHPVITDIPPEKLQQEVVEAHKAITEAIQQQPTMLFRPPTGEINDQAGKAVASAGYPIIAMYDVTTLDWDANNSAQDIVNGIMSKTKPGSVILLHMLDDIHTIEALPTAIEGLKKKGYTFVKMADMIGMNSK